MKLPSHFGRSFYEPIKKHKSFVNFMLIVVAICIFCAILASIKFNKSSFLISFSNVVVVKFLRGSTGFGGMLFSSLFSVAVFSVIIICSCYKKYTISIGVFFYAYYAYAQTLTLIAFMLEYGIINTLIVAFCMLLCLVAMLFLMLELFLVCLDFQNSYRYIKCAFSACVPFLIAIMLLLVCQGIVFFVIKNYMIVLVY